MATGTDKVPDAVRVPIGWRGNGTKFERADTLNAAVEPLLGVGPGQAHCRILGVFGQVYVTKEPGDDPMLFPSTHPTRAKQPRYDWVEQPELGAGVYFGYLKPEARAELEAKDA